MTEGRPSWRPLSSWSIRFRRVGCAALDKRSRAARNAADPAHSPSSAASSIGASPLSLHLAFHRPLGGLRQCLALFAGQKPRSCDDRAITPSPRTSDGEKQHSHQEAIKRNEGDHQPIIDVDKTVEQIVRNETSR